MNLIEKINTLKNQKNAIILAHNYVNDDLQKIADFVGDSLELSQKAAQINADMIVFCGVKFMAETAKILSPNTTVLLPNLKAGCPMADGVNIEKLKQFKKENPNFITVAYVNTTAELKAEIDICCTSANVENVLNTIPEDKPILFLPDQNLGKNIANKIKRKNITFWKGCCPIHDAITPEMLINAKNKHPNAITLIHPEAPPNTIELADFSLSTGQMIRYVAESQHQEFIIATESGIIHRLLRENPNKTFYTLEPELICPDMKVMTLQDLYEALLYNQHEIKLPNDIIVKAASPIQKMLDLKQLKP